MTTVPCLLAQGQVRFPVFMLEYRKPDLTAKALLNPLEKGGNKGHH